VLYCCIVVIVAVAVAVAVGGERFEGGCEECALRNQITSELIGKNGHRRKQQQTNWTKRDFDNESKQ
jgi:hypothetical protein